MGIDLQLIANHRLETLKKKFKDCFSSDIKVHSQVLNATLYSEDGLKCPKIFDGLSCWDPTPTGAIAYQNCPDFVIGFDENRLSYKKCLNNGTWATHPQGVNSWTNYTTCINVEDLSFRQKVNGIYIFGYAISAIALILSMIIFHYFRSLRCTRIRIHMHLFTSFAIHNILWISWYFFVVNDVTVVQDNLIWCQILHVVIHYFMVSNYMWMFCEALHLHISLVIVFVREDLAMRWLKIIGWVVPFVIVSIYAISRYSVDGATDRCWMDPSETFWIITGPVVASLATSLAFMINIIRVLMTKLRPNCRHNNAAAVKKTIRATIILIPLFGLHFVLMPLRPRSGSEYERVYDVTSAVTTSLQGLLVAVLFCFTNQDVIEAFKQLSKRQVRGNEMIPLGGVTGAESLANTRGRSSRDSTLSCRVAA